MPKAGTTYANGYGKRHEALRLEWKPKVDAGKVTCWRCGEWIDPLTDWDLGHDDSNRGQYRGPEHSGCNRSAGARASHVARGHQIRVKRAW